MTTSHDNLALLASWAASQERPTDHDQQTDRAQPRRN